MGELVVGPEMDALVHEAVFGEPVLRNHRASVNGRPVVEFAEGLFSTVRPYSTNIEAAWRVAEKLGLIVGPTYQDHPKAPKYCACIGWQEGLQRAYAEGMTAPEAICRAALACAARDE